MKEVWKDIVRYEGLYQVSNYGKVRSIQRIITYNGVGKGGGKRLYPSIELKPCLNSVGYYQVSLSVNNKRKRYMVHRLVAEAFCFHPINKDCVNHIDGDYLNNKCDNLEWVSTKENVRHAILNGLHKIYGEDSHLAKFTNIQADIIRKIRHKGITTKELTILLGVSKYCINNIYKGVSYNKNNKIKSYK